MRSKGIRIGAGAAFSDDRFEPALEPAERGDIDYLVFEYLAERTIARKNTTRLKEPDQGYRPHPVERFGRVLPE